MFLPPGTRRPGSRSRRSGFWESEAQKGIAENLVPGNPKSLKQKKKKNLQKKKVPKLKQDVDPLSVRAEQGHSLAAIC